MPRQFFTRLSKRFDRNRPPPWYLKPFNFLLTHPVYFSAGRRSVSGGLALGLLVGLLPIPGQTALAVLGALVTRVNLPLAAVAVWITNPVTFVPIFYLEYRIGAALLNIPVEALPAQADFQWMTAELAARLQPLLFGSLLVATSVASIAYVTISAVWHISTRQRYRERHRKARPRVPPA